MPPIFYAFGVIHIHIYFTFYCNSSKFFLKDVIDSMKSRRFLHRALLRKGWGNFLGDLSENIFRSQLVSEFERQCLLA